MIVGYCRTSTIEQTAGFDAQERDLRAAGVERIFSEQVSSIGVRPQLDAALDFVRDGDVFSVTKIDRLARSVPNLLEIVGRLNSKGVTLRILNLGLDTSTPTGKLMLTMLGAVGEFEREMMLERQKEGIAKARSEGRYQGRKPTARAQSEDVKALSAEGLSMGAIASKLKIGKGSVHRILKAAAPSEAA